MSKTMIEEYQELVPDNYETWLGKNGKKALGTNSVNTALDEQENRAMYNAYVQEVNAQNAYGRTKAALDNNQSLALEANANARANTMRENAIMTERAMEYAKRRAALSGFSNSGMSETAMIDLYSQMAGARADAAASYDAQKSDIMQEYQNAILEAQGARDTAISTAKGGADAVAAEVGVKRAERVDLMRESRVTDVQNALADYEAGNISYDELTEIYEKNEGVLNPEADSEIINEYNDLVGNKAKDADFVANNPFGITNASTVCDTSTLTLEELNKYLDVSGAGDGDEQDEWVEGVLRKIRLGKIADGTIIDMNYGSIGGQNKGNYFIYQNGKLYKTDLKFDKINEFFGFNMWNSNGFSDAPATGDGEKTFELNGKKYTFIRKDD